MDPKYPTVALDPLVRPGVEFFNFMQCVKQEWVEVPPCPAFCYHKSCNGCGTQPIEGVRFRCETCEDYFLCQICETKYRPSPCIEDHNLKRSNVERRDMEIGYASRKIESKVAYFTVQVSQVTGLIEQNIQKSTIADVVSELFAGKTIDSTCGWCGIASNKTEKIGFKGEPPHGLVVSFPRIKFCPDRCMGCATEPIQGMRYKCLVCPNYFLCVYCYKDLRHRPRPCISRHKMAELSKF